MHSSRKHTHKPLLQFPGRIIYADCKVVQLLWCCTEQNSRCVLYNRSRGKEGRVEEDYRQNFPSFLLPTCISTFLSLSRQTGSLSVSFFLYPLYFPLSMLSYTSHSLSRSFFSLLNPRRLRCCLRENVGHLFSAIPLTPTRRRRWKW